jgi:hypothetical protein
LLASCIKVYGCVLNCQADLDESLYGGDVIVGYLDVITFNPIASTVLK